MNTLEKIRNTILNEQMLPPEGHIIVALSGGADSVCLLATLAQLTKRRTEKHPEERPENLLDSQSANQPDNQPENSFEKWAGGQSEKNIATQSNGQCNGQIDIQSNGQCNGQIDIQSNGQRNGQIDIQSNSQCNGQIDIRSNGQRNGQLNSQLNTQLNTQEITLSAIHIHHGIRGPEADADEASCRELCHKWQVPLTVIHRDIPALAKQWKMSLEEAGRRERYRCFEEEAARFANEENCPHVRVALAHHLEDQAETVLLNICRGTGIRGLGGIPARRGLYIRPLAGLHRHEIEHWLTEQGIPWQNDSTNASDDYTRNRLRHTVIPYLEKEINERTVEHIAFLAAQARSADDFLDQEAEKWLSQPENYQHAAKIDRQDTTEYPQIVETNPQNVEEHPQFAAPIDPKMADYPYIAGLTSAATEIPPQAYTLNADTLRKLHPALRQRILHKTICHAAGRSRDIGERHIHAAEELLEKPVSTRIHLPYGIQIRRGYHELFLEPTTPPPGTSPTDGTHHRGQVPLAAATNQTSTTPPPGTGPTGGTHHQGQVPPATAPNQAPTAPPPGTGPTGGTHHRGQVPPAAAINPTPIAENQPPTVQEQPSTVKGQTSTALGDLLVPTAMEELSVQTTTDNLPASTDVSTDAMTGSDETPRCLFHGEHFNVYSEIPGLQARIRILPDSESEELIRSFSKPAESEGEEEVLSFSNSPESKPEKLIRGFSNSPESKPEELIRSFSKPAESEGEEEIRHFSKNLESETAEPLQALGQPLPPNVYIEKNLEKNYTKWLDYDKIYCDIFFRTRKSGDRIHLPGVGVKKIKSYMIDAKIPAKIRSQIVLLAAESRVLWIVGYRLSADARITPATRRVLEITLDPGEVSPECTTKDINL